MYSAENHKSAPLPRQSADLVSAQCVPRVYSYTYDISSLDATQIQGF
jgi:hypothetical protein